MSKRYNESSQSTLPNKKVAVIPQVKTIDLLIEKKPKEISIGEWTKMLNEKPDYLTIEQWVEWNTEDGIIQIFIINELFILNFFYIL
jgi:hypothetical protein